MSRKFLYLLASCGTFLIAPCLRAGTGPAEQTAAATSEEKVEATPLDLFAFEEPYVFESDLNHGGSFGKQSEIETEFEYGHRIRLSGNYYLHLGLTYDRYDFGSTSAPVPNHLQEIAGVVGSSICTAMMWACFSRCGRLLFPE